MNACTLIHSLPLMGIGNGRNDSTLKRAESAHYPSWGLGTARRGASWRLASTSHYPSWGLGTLGYLPRIRRTTTGLITPHGDWEHDVPGLLHLELRLITPHGDWELDRGRWIEGLNITSHYPSWGLGTIVPNQEQTRFLNSLPLMGIGNVYVRLDGGPWLPLLITPHGDWEPF